MKFKEKLGDLQKIGKALLMPIAVLPVASILLRLGAPDVVELLHINSICGPLKDILLALFLVMNSSGKIIFDNLPLLFAVGIAIGLTEGAGASAIASVVGYFVFQQVILSMTPFLINIGLLEQSAKIDMGVFAGIIVGLVVSYLYKRYKDMKLPDYLQFFGGRRFVPLVSAFVLLIMGIFTAFIWPPIQNAIHFAGMWIIGNGSIGIFIYGFLNRLLLPFGLHHILNSIVWFMIGDYTTSSGAVVSGDLNRFFAGDKTAGIFMTGFYPIMMFGLPAACLAMINAARPEKKKLISGLLLGAAFTSFLTGVTEPIEFAFMFLAPFLYIIHAVLTGLSLVIANLWGIKEGFGFSAGLIDYLLSFGISTNPLLTIPLGLLYGMIYYVLFTACIKYFNILTPGREKDEDEMPLGGSRGEISKSVTQKALAIIYALGGKTNIVSIDSCITRLRLKIKDEKLINENVLKAQGTYGIIHLGGGNLQVVIGTQAELISEQMKTLKTQEKLLSPITGRIIQIEDVPDEVFAQKMMGDGLAIEASEGKAYAPVSGELTVLFPTYHAFGIRTPEGIEVLVHIGINTVELMGIGFNAHKKQGDIVKTGDLIVSFDIELCKSKGKSLISPVLITNMEQILTFQKTQQAEINAVKEILFEVEIKR